MNEKPTALFVQSINVESLRGYQVSFVIFSVRIVIQFIFRPKVSSDILSLME